MKDGKEITVDSSQVEQVIFRDSQSRLRSQARRRDPISGKVKFIKANGPEKAAEEFTNGKSFKDRDLYISYLDFNGKMLAHGSNPKLVGKELMELKDPEGKFMVKMAIDVAKTKGKGWTEDYKFKNPTTEKLQEKAMYVERVGDAYVGVGIYK